MVRLAAAAARRSTGPSYLLSLLSNPTRPPPRPTLFPYTTLFRSPIACGAGGDHLGPGEQLQDGAGAVEHAVRSEEHTSELQSRGHLVCRLLLAKKNTAIMQT